MTNKKIVKVKVPKKGKEEKDDDFSSQRIYVLENENEALGLRVGDLTGCLRRMKELLMKSDLPYRVVAHQVGVIDEILERESSSYRV